MGTIEQTITDLDWAINKAGKSIDNGEINTSLDFMHMAKEKLEYLINTHPKNRLTEKYAREYNLLLSSHEEKFKLDLKSERVYERNNYFIDTVYNTIEYMKLVEDMMCLGHQCASKTCLNIIGKNLSYMLNKFPQSTSVKGLSVRYLGLIKEYVKFFGEDYLAK